MKIDVLKNILMTSVVKKQSTFDKNELIDYTKEYEKYRLCFYSIDTPTTHDYVRSDFDIFTIINIPNDKTRLGCIDEIIENTYMITTYLKPDDVEYLLTIKRKYVVAHYSDKNEYVRLLMGLPGYYTDTNDFITLRKAGYSAEVVRPINIDTPVQYLDDMDVAKMYSDGIIFKLIEMYPDALYLQYLYRRSTCIEIREAEAYSLINVPEIFDSEFIELYKMEYAKNKNYFTYTLRNTFYEQYKDNYEALSIIYLLTATLSTTLLKSATYTYDFDYDNKDMEGIIKSILLSNGLDNLILPKINMKRLMDHLNSMISMKGTKQVMIDIKKILDVSNVYRYVLRKKYNGDDMSGKSGARIVTDDEWETAIATREGIADNFELLLYRVPVSESDIRPYIDDSDEGNIIKYDDMIADDPYWGDGVDNLRTKLLQEDFNYIETKYVSVENMFELTKTAYDMSALWRYVYSKEEVTDDFRKGFSLRYARNNINLTCTIFDAFFYAASLIVSIRGYDDVIPDTVSNITYVMSVNYNQDYSKYAYLFRMMFKDKNIKEKLIPSFVDSNNITDTADFMNRMIINNENLAILKKLIEKITDIEEYRLATTFYDALTTATTLKTVFGDTPKTYKDYLCEKVPGLYRVLTYIETDAELLKEELNYILDVINRILNMEDDPDVADALSITSVIKTEYGGGLVHELVTILKYFKSMSVELKDYSIVYKLDTEFHRFAILDTQAFEEEEAVQSSHINVNDYEVADCMIINSTFTTVANRIFSDPNGIGSKN